MSDKDPEQLIDDVIAYLKQQRDMFGDFGYRNKTPNKKELEDAPSDNTSTFDHSSKDEKPVNQKDSEEEEENRESESNVELTATSEGAQSSSNSTDSADETDKSTATESATNEEQFTDPPPASAQQENSLFATNPDASDNIYDQVEACSSLKELYELCRKTDVLRTDLEGTNLVFGVGNPEADLVLIGEAPGSEEDKQGEPFVGRAGKLLNKILDAIDLKRDDVYIANILKHRPPNNRNPLPEEVKRSLPFLIKQLDLINPNLILCLGKVAANTLLDKNTSLKSMRGTFYNFMNRYELLVTYHPAALLRNERFKRPTWEDMKMLKKRYDELEDST